MTVKVHKEVQIFKRICSHDEFKDHVEEVNSISFQCRSRLIPTILKHFNV